MMECNRSCVAPAVEARHTLSFGASPGQAGVSAQSAS